MLFNLQQGQLGRRKVVPVVGVTTWNPSDATAGWTLTNGNSRATVASTGRSIRCTRGSAAGEKLYCEIPIITIGSVGLKDSFYIGLCLGSQSINSIASPFWLINGDGTVFVAGGSGSGGSGAPVNTDYLQFAYDHDLKRVWIGKNNVWRNSGDPAAGTGFVYQFTSVASFKIVLQTDTNNSSDSHTVDFNDGTAYAGTLPTGFTKW